MKKYVRLNSKPKIFSPYLKTFLVMSVIHKLEENLRVFQVKKIDEDI